MQNMTSLEIKMDKGHIQFIELEDSVFEQWRRLGTAEGLDNDTAIAAFLLQCYKNHPQEPKQDVFCISCRAALPLVCKTCDRNRQGQQQDRHWQQSLQSTDLDSVQSSVSGKKVKRQRTKSSSVRGRKKHRSRSDTPKISDSTAARTNKQTEESAVHVQQHTGFSAGSNFEEDGETFETDTCLDSTNGNETSEVSKPSLSKSKTKPQTAKASKKKEEPEHPFLCQLCGASFGKARGLKRHQIVHTGEKPHVCNICPAAFANKSVLITHIRKHTGEKPFLCPHCGAAFAQRYNLTTHLRTHSGERPHKCDRCWRSFTTSSALTRHVRIHTGEKPYVCVQCGATFSASGNLKGHMRNHSGIKDFVCQLCGAAFATSTRLKRHQRLVKCADRLRKDELRPYPHSHVSIVGPNVALNLAVPIIVTRGEKPYVCVQCGAAFPQSGNLREHMRKHTGIKDFQCQLCGTKFATSTRLKRHQKLVKCADRQRTRFVLTLGGDTPVDLS